jgi:serine/threonine protein kinase
MKTRINCPQTEELRELLDGSLSGERQMECTDHMDSCECCQARLEEIATDGSNLSRIVEHLNTDEPVANSAYWPALQSLDGPASSPLGLQPTIVPESGPVAVARERDLSLSFLQPASDAAYLGRLGHFDAMRVIGRGGMGLVLEAFDSKLQRNVALKVLDPVLADDETARQRFCREARAAASITHENVVAVHQVERSGDASLPFLVMQLINGESLEQRLAREKKLPLREVVRIGMQAAHGLVAAHAQGLIHRDIKPGNILLEPPHDRVKLTDFGLARAAEDVKLTRTGFVSGTPLYMAPEQALGGEPDHRSDLFSLGAILYEMCAGQPPFTGTSALMILRQIAETKHRPIRELNPAIPDWFADTIDSLLAKKPADRIQTAAHLAELLDYEWALLKTTSEDVPTVCAIEERKRTIRNRWIAAGVAATFLTLGLLGGMFLANRNGTGSALPAVAAVAPAVSSAEPLAVLSANSGAVWSVSFSPDNKKVAMAVEDGRVRLWDLTSKSVTSTLMAHRSIVWATQFSPNGELLATAGDDGLIKLWQPSLPEPGKTLQQTNAVRGLVFSNDGKMLYTGGRDGGLRVWSLDADGPAVEAQQPGAVYAVALSPDNETLGTAGNDKVVRLWNARTLTEKLSLEGSTGPILGLAFNHDGKRVASAGWDHMVRIWDAGSGQPVKSWEGHDGDIWGIAYSPDGTKLVTGGHDGAVKLWNAETGDLLATYLGHKIAIHTVAFSADGTLIASGGRDGAVRIWKVE